MKTETSFRAENLRDLQTIAERISSQIRMGDWVWFEGELGAGKTELVRSIMKAWGYEGQITSPTYLIMNEYELWGRKIYHIDGFRLEGITEGVWDPEALKKGICFVEWPERTQLPNSRFQWKISIHVEAPSNARLIKLISNPFS